MFQYHFACSVVHPYVNFLHALSRATILEHLSFLSSGHIEGKIITEVGIYKSKPKNTLSTKKATKKGKQNFIFLIVLLGVFFFSNFLVLFYKFSLLLISSFSFRNTSFNIHMYMFKYFILKSYNFSKNFFL